jgi:7-alpha-hydroxysteroid dehydrogenase
VIFERFRMVDQVAVVTGASHGIGRACCLAFAEAGADVVLAARRADDLEDTAREVRALGRRALVVPTDVRQTAQLDALVARASADLGRLDVVLNNVGGADPANALETTDEALEEAFHNNVTTQLHLARAAAKHLARSPNGNVVNVSAVVGRIPERGLVPYATARAAQLYMTRLLALEWAPKIRVNAVAIGGVDTAGLREFLASNPSMRADIEKAIPMRRVGRTEDVAAAVLYLASPAGSWVTGKVLELDGGVVAPSSPFPFRSGLDDE